MLLHLSVSHSVRRGVTGQTPPRADNSPQTANAVDGTHPTGMHSCTSYLLSRTVREVLVQHESLLNLKFPGYCCKGLSIFSLFVSQVTATPWNNVLSSSVK